MSEHVTQILDAHAQDSDALIAELASLGPIQYGQRRKEVSKQLGVPVGAVDDAVRLAKREASESEERLLFPQIEPTGEPVDGGELLTEIAGEISRYIVLSEHELTAAALWTLHTHAIEASYIAPILAVQSPQKRCGKTQLLKLLAALVHRGLMTENFSLAALYRVMDEYRPTLLIDEADAFLDDQEEIRGLINAGHSRGTRTLRIGGENRDTVEVFDSFGPKALAGIGKRKDTIADRAIIIRLRRRRPDECVELLRLDRLDYRALLSRSAGWAAQNMDALKASDPSMPESLHDRAQDNWRPLIAIADMCGWGTKARRAAVALTGTDDAETVGVMVLDDIQKLYTDQKVDRLSSAYIVEILAGMEDRPWPEWGRTRKPITQRQLATLLAPFDIAPKLMKISGAPVRGYRLDQFTDAFSRYLANSALTSVTPLPASDGAALSGSPSVTDDVAVTDRSVTATDPVTDNNTLKPSNDAAGNGVTDENTDLAGGEQKSDDDPLRSEYRI